MEKESTTLICNIELNAIGDDGKIKICPVGDVQGADGRLFRIDGNQMILNTKQKRTRFPLLIRHGLDSKYGGDAAGWFDSNTLEVRADGIYATLEKNSLGEELISKKIYGLLSPAFSRYFEGDVRVGVDLIEVSLENEANFYGLEVNKLDQATGFNRLDQESEQAKEINSLKVRNAELEAQLHALKVDLAIEQNKLLPKDRELALTLNEAQLIKLIETNSYNLNHLRTKIEANQSESESDQNKIASRIERTIKFAKGDR